MKLSDFGFNLPEHLIAQFPATERTGSRLLVLNRDNGAVQHQRFTDLPDFLQPNDLLIFNNTKVIPARLYGQKSTGAKLEILIERVLPEQQALAFVKCNKSPKEGAQLQFDGELHATVLGRQDNLFVIQFHTPDLLSHREAVIDFP